MSTYSGNKFTVAKSAAQIQEKFSDLTAMQRILDQLPEEEKSKVGDITLDSDAIHVTAPQLGPITLKVTERNDKRIAMEAQGLPVPLQMHIDLDQKAPESTEVCCSLDVDIPFMLKPLVAPHLSKVMEGISNVIEKVVG